MTNRPLPDVTDPLTAPFWAAAAERKLVVQACGEGGYLRWPPGPLCPECQTEGGAWTEVRPTGVLWSVATYHRALDPAFADEVPYSVALVELDDGPRMYGRITGNPENFVLDTPVQATFHDVAPGVTLVGWNPAPSAPPEAPPDATGNMAGDEHPGPFGIKYLILSLRLSASTSRRFRAGDRSFLRFINADGRRVGVRTRLGARSWTSPSRWRQPSRG